MAIYRTPAKPFEEQKTRLSRWKKFWARWSKPQPKKTTPSYFRKRDVWVIIAGITAIVLFYIHPAEISTILFSLAIIVMIHLATL